MELTIIIVNWNTRELLRNCLASIERSKGDLAVQTIVVDNNSADGSRDMVAAGFPGMLLMNSGGNLGFAKANNLALPHVQAPLVLYLNPDTEIRGTALQDMVAFMNAHAEVGALGCKVRDISGEITPLGLQWFPSPLTEFARLAFLSDGAIRRLRPVLPWHDPEKSGYVRKLFGACLLVPKRVLDKVGAFDDRFFMYCEDVDLCHRVAQGGWKVYYLSEVEILHLGGGASPQAPSSFSVLMMCDSLSKFMRKYYGGFGAALYRLATLAGAQARLLLIALIRAGSLLRAPESRRDLTGPARKYRVTVDWALGRQKPVIKG